MSGRKLGAYVIAATFALVALVGAIVAVVVTLCALAHRTKQPLMVVINGAPHIKSRGLNRADQDHNLTRGIREPLRVGPIEPAKKDGELQSRAPGLAGGNPSSSDVEGAHLIVKQANARLSDTREPVTADTKGQPRADEASRPLQTRLVSADDRQRNTQTRSHPSSSRYPGAGQHGTALQTGPTLRSGVAQPGRAPLRPEMATGPAEVAGSNPAAASSTLRDSAIQNAEEEIWQLTQGNQATNPLPSSAHASTRTASATSMSVAMMRSVNSAAAATTASTSSPTVDCRSSYSAPDPKDPSLAAVGWRDAIAEASANAAVAERWRRSIWSGSSERWIKDSYESSLRCHGDVVAGWLEEVRFTRKPALSPLEWMCEHGLDSPLWMRKVTIHADWPSDIAYTYVRVSVGRWASYGAPLFKVDVPISALPDPHCVHCEFEIVEPCIANPLRSVTWELVAPGRIEPGPREMQP